MFAARARAAMRDSPIVSVVIGVAVVALVATVVRISVFDWHPMGDYRTLQLRVSDVGSSHTPLVGLYSRFDWNHPAPWVFWFLAIPYRMFGETGLLLGAIAVNVAAVIASIAVCLRAGRRWMLVCALVVAVLCGGLGLGGLADPWNPYLVVLPSFAMLVGAWRAIDGSRSGALLAVIAGSFAMGSHFGAAPLVLSILAVVVVSLVWQSMRGTDRGRARTTALWCVLAAAVMWLPALVEQAVHDPGNLRTLATFVLDGGRGAVNGSGSGVRIVSRSLALPFDWATGSAPTFAGGPLDDRSWAIPVGFVALLVATFVAWRRVRDGRDERRAPELHLCIVALVAVAAEVVAMSRINGLLAPYLVRTTWAVAAIVWMAVLGVVVGVVADRVGPRVAIDRSIAVLVGAVLVVTMARGIDVAPLRPPGPWARAEEAIVGPVLATVSALPGPVLVDGGFGADGAVASEVASSARAAGDDVYRPSWMGFIVGPHRTIADAAVASTVMIVSGDVRHDYEADPAWHEIVTYDPLTPAERSELATIRERVTADTDVTGLDPVAAERARSASLLAWKDANDYSHHPGVEYLRWKELSRDTDVVAAFWRSGPPA